MKQVLMISAIREAYGVDDVLDKTMTVGELIQFLEEYCDEDTKLVFSHDGGYTYGGIRENLIDLDDYYSDEDEDE